MIRNHGRRAVLAAGLAALVITLPACVNPQKQLESGPIGANASAATIDVHNVHTEPPEKASYSIGDDVVVRFALFNRAEVRDELRRVETSLATQVRLHWDADCDGTAEPTSRLPLPANSTVPEPPGGGPGTAYHLELLGLNEEVREGTTMPLTFTFEKAGPVTVDALVPTGEDSEVPPLGCEPG
ncbi:copper chaperone PCu(A)C [Qaidamihabitans albus]|uniref:copper chaperone PCu(A)C n=1 Tax=Qaidamihabitans albus TaxID=2795733 RepID=UPI0018F1C402|nr:copper chaperone PCu(A)C [Qaidamihabitans albus]